MKELHLLTADIYKFNSFIFFVKICTEKRI